MRRALAALLCLACSSAPAPTPTSARRVAPPAETEPEPASPSRRVAVTIDDLPWVGGVAQGETRAAGVSRILAAAGQREAPVAGFFTCHRGEGREAAQRVWLEAPIALGNHTRSHRSIDELGIDGWRRDVRACQTTLEEAAGREVPFFRYPYLRTGAERELRDEGFAFLREMQLTRAPVTIDTSEWALVRPYLEARAAHDDARAAAIGEAYVRHVQRATRRFFALAARDGHADAPQILLLHANALAADHLGAVLDALREDGATFVDLPEALAHPLYSRVDHYVGGVGLSWLYRVRPDAGDSWAWDAAQLSGLQTRFAARAEPRTFDLDAELRVRRIAERTWVVTHDEPFPANSLVAEMADGTVLLVDTPYTDEATRALLDWLDARFGPRRRVALNTHFHPDALGGNAALLDAEVEVYGSLATARLARSRNDAIRAQLASFLAERPAMAARFADYVPTPPERTFPLHVPPRFHFGEQVAVFFPGAAHSPDNVVVWLPDRGVLFGGCMVSGRDSLGNLADADLETWPIALGRLENLAPSVVIPGHGEPGGAELLARTRAQLAAHPAE